MWDQLTIGYLAGIIEADGTITSNGMSIEYISNELGRTAKNPIVKVNMVDKEVIDRLYSLTGIGKVAGPYHYSSKNRPNNQPTWLWSVSVSEDVARLLLAIAPLLSEKRRREAMIAAEVLAVRTKPRFCTLSSCEEKILRGPNAKYCTLKCTRKAEKIRIKGGG